MRGFESERADAQAARAVISQDTSAESLVKLLSSDNIGLLRAIRARRPISMRALAEMTGSKKSNLSRTLQKFVQAGLVRLVQGEGRRLRPVVIARKVRLEIDFSSSAEGISLVR